jgi:hypothetical protein
MFAAALKLVGFDLSRQFARLRHSLDAFKERTTEDIKQKAIDAGVAIGLAMAGLLFVLLTIFAALGAFYLYVEMLWDPWAGLAAVALTCAVLAVLLFVTAAWRGKKRASTVPPPAAAAAGQVRGFSAAGESVTQKLTDRTATVANEALDSAAWFVRRSPRETILAVLGAAIVVGVLIGRNRLVTKSLANHIR